MREKSTIKLKKILPPVFAEIAEFFCNYVITQADLHDVLCPKRTLQRSTANPGGSEYKVEMELYRGVRQGWRSRKATAPCCGLS